MDKPPTLPTHFHNPPACPASTTSIAQTFQPCFRDVHAVLLCDRRYGMILSTPELSETKLLHPKQNPCWDGAHNLLVQMTASPPHIQAPA